MAKRINILTILIILVALLSLSFGSLGQGHPGGEPPSGETETISFNGYCNVGETWEETAEFSKGSIIKVEFVLTWTDDEGEDSEPDTLSLMTSDGMHEPKSEQDSSGMVLITWEEDRLNDTWSMAVTCESAGPTQVPLGLIGIITQEEPDPGNSFSLDVTFTYSEGRGGGPPPGVQAVLDSPVFKTHVAFMIASVFLYLGTGIIALAFLTRNYWGPRVSEQSFLKRTFTNLRPLVFIVILSWILFFLAAIPLGMWVAGMYYGPTKAWTGIPAIWNPSAFEMTNADNVSLIVLILWGLPLYLNRAWVMRGKIFNRYFGRFGLVRKRVEKAPDPKLSYREFALCYFLMGVFIYVVFMVQPHGSGS